MGGGGGRGGGLKLTQSTDCSINQSIIQSVFPSDSKLLMTICFLLFFADLLRTALKTLLTDFAKYDKTITEYTAGLFHFTTETINTMSLDFPT